MAHGFDMAITLQVGPPHEDTEILATQAELEAKAAALASETAGAANAEMNDPEQTKTFQSRAAEIFAEAQEKGVSLQSFKSPEDLVKQSTEAGALDEQGKPNEKARDTFLNNVQEGHDSFLKHARANGASAEFLAAAEAHHQKFLDYCAKMNAEFQERVGEMQAQAKQSQKEAFGSMAPSDDLGTPSASQEPPSKQDPQGISGGGDVMRDLVAKFQQESGFSAKFAVECKGEQAMPEGGPSAGGMKIRQTGMGGPS